MFLSGKQESHDSLLLLPPIIVSKKCIELCGLRVLTLSCFGNIPSIVNRCVFKKWRQLVFHTCVSLWSHKIGPVIVVALIAHHTPNLTACKGTFWTNMESSADSYLFYENSATDWDETKFHDKTRWVGLIAPMCILWRYNFAKFSFCFKTSITEFLNCSCMTRIQIQWFDCILCCWHRHIHVVCKSGQSFPWWFL